MSQSFVLIDSLTKCWEWALPYYCPSWAKIISVLAFVLIFLVALILFQKSRSIK